MEKNNGKILYDPKMVYSNIVYSLMVMNPYGTMRIKVIFEEEIGLSEARKCFSRRGAFSKRPKKFQNQSDLDISAPSSAKISYLILGGSSQDL